MTDDEKFKDLVDTYLLKIDNKLDTARLAILEAQLANDELRKEVNRRFDE